MFSLGILSVSTPEWDIAEAAAAYAAAGLQGVGWRATEDKGDRQRPSFWGGNRTSQTPAQVIEQAGELRDLCASHRLAMPTLGTYVNSTEPEAVAECLQAALAIGAGSIRVNPCRYPIAGKRHGELLAECREQFRALAPLARKSGVRIFLETHHGFLAPSVGLAMQILDGLDPAEFGIIWDPCNQLNEGLETYAMAIDLAGPFLAEVHVKNLIYQRGPDARWAARYCAVDEGLVHWPKALEELAKSGYRGWLMLEDFSTDLPVQERLSRGAGYLRTLLDRLT
jgi:sugar phosphate isomerase/epimerase